VREVVAGAFESPEDVEVRRFCRQGHGRGRERRLAVEPGSAQHRAGEEVRDRLQVIFVAYIPV
jgi:hypothetical protein